MIYGYARVSTDGQSVQAPAITRSLRRQSHTAWADQTRIGRLKAPERAAGCPLEVDVLVIRTAERKVGRCRIPIRDRHETQDHTARVDFENTAEARAPDPQISMDVIMNAIGPGVAGQIGARFDALVGR